MDKLMSFLKFEWFIFPIVFSILYVITTIGVIFAALGFIIGGYFLQGIGLLVVGPIIARLVYEFLIVYFQALNGIIKIAGKK